MKQLLTIMAVLFCLISCSKKVERPIEVKGEIIHFSDDPIIGTGCVPTSSDSLHPGPGWFTYTRYYFERFSIAGDFANEPTFSDTLLQMGWGDRAAIFPTTGSTGFNNVINIAYGENSVLRHSVTYKINK